jgi:TM2 domain-containing membrane protein YozV
MIEFILSYLMVGVVVSAIGCYLHSKAWHTTYLESFMDGFLLWITAAIFWPLALDLLLEHQGYKE